MSSCIRWSWALAVLLGLQGSGSAAEQVLSRARIGKLGKASTALVEVNPIHAYGTAFCVHPSGLFVTNDHVAQNNITLILNPSLKNEKSYPAKVVRRNKDLDLALLRIEGAPEVPALELGSDEDLSELTEVVAFGFPFGTALTPGRNEYPAISINVGSITSLRRKDGRLHRIQLDAVLNPGNSGGPVLDQGGKVIGVVVSGVVGRGVNFAIPVSAVREFLAQPVVDFEPPVLKASQLRKPVRFEARVTSLVPSTAPLAVELQLRTTKAEGRPQRMEQAGGKYCLEAVPPLPPKSTQMVRISAQFSNGWLNATAPDQDVKVGDEELKLSQLRRIQKQPSYAVHLSDGRQLDAPVKGLEAVPIQLDDQVVSVNLARLSGGVTLQPEVHQEYVQYSLIVKQGDKEVYRQSGGLMIEGPPEGGEPIVIKAPALASNRVECKVGEISDVAVGGGGRYLVLYRPAAQALDVFDVNVARVVGHIRVAEDKIHFAAGRDCVVIVLPRTKRIERWSLKTLKREYTAALPVNGVVKCIAMGSASNGPLLVHWSPGTEDVARCSYSLVRVDNMELVGASWQAQLGVSYRDVVHLRAAANGQLFGVWCSGQSPMGVGVVTVERGQARFSYGHETYGAILPAPDGKTIFTDVGRCNAVGVLQTKREVDQLVVPACHGDYYLTLSRSGVPMPGQTRPLVPTVYKLGRAAPVATLDKIERLTAPPRGLHDDFLTDKRYYLIPDAKLLITIPYSNDRLVLHRFDG